MGLLGVALTLGAAALASSANNSSSTSSSSSSNSNNNSSSIPPYPTLPDEFMDNTKEMNMKSDIVYYRAGYMIARNRNDAINILSYCKDYQDRLEYKGFRLSKIGDESVDRNEAEMRFNISYQGNHVADMRVCAENSYSSYGKSAKLYIEVMEKDSLLPAFPDVSEFGFTDDLGEKKFDKSGITYYRSGFMKINIDNVDYAMECATNYVGELEKSGYTVSLLSKDENDYNLKDYFNVSYKEKNCALFSIIRKPLPNKKATFEISLTDYHEIAKNGIPQSTTSEEKEKNTTQEKSQEKQVLDPDSATEADYYLQAKQLYYNKEYEKSLDIFSTILAYKDSQAYCNAIKQMFEAENAYNLALELYQKMEFKKAYDIFSSILTYKDSYKYYNKLEKLFG